MRAPCVLASIALLCVSGEAGAYEFRCRWVERVGNTDTVIGGDGATLDASDGPPRRIRLQFGVFDDAAGDAPSGGILGWNFGTLAIDGDAVAARTPGRLAPFNFSNQATANGSPLEDPFAMLTEIDATLGMQSVYWGFDGNENPLPQPNPTIRGLNIYNSVYELTIDPGVLAADVTIAAAGNLVAAASWLTIGTPVPPIPNSHVPTSVTYAPLPTSPVAFGCTLRVHVIPAPGVFGMVVGAGALGLSRGRRRPVPSHYVA